MTHRSPADRPRLKDGITPLWRSTSTVQIGLDQRRALVIGEVDASAAAVLRSLDGRRSRQDIITNTGAAGSVLLDLLEDQGLVEDAAEVLPPALADLDTNARARIAPELAALALAQSQASAGVQAFAHRRSKRALVIGAGRIGTAIAHVLAASGVGRVTIDDELKVSEADVCPGAASSADVGLRRSSAATALAARALPPALRAGPTDIAVICTDGTAPPSKQLWKPLLAQQVCVLPVNVREATAVVGPLVEPGAIGLTGCPNCVELHRIDRDPSWPLMSEQLRRRPAVASTAAVALVWATAALACAQLLAVIDQQIAEPDIAREADAHTSAGASLELTSPGWTWRRRWWGPHPACACRSAFTGP